MLFEGNDLENSYMEARPSGGGQGGVRRLVGGTVLELPITAVELVKEGSVITKLRDAAAGHGVGIVDPERYVVDGVTLAAPLYRSQTLGPSLFLAWDIERATYPRSYVEEHPNRASLEQVFSDMRALGEEYGFRVTVTVAPSAPRLQGPAFDGFPELSDRPHFIDFIDDLSERTGFAYFDLLGAMQPYAQSEMLYFRDDHHWNERGNALAAEILYQALWSSN